MDRKRIQRWLTGLLLVVLIFFVGRTCQAEHADITVVFSSPVTVEAFSAEVLRDDERVAYFASSGLSPDGEKQWTLGLDPGSYTLSLEVTIDGKTRSSSRRLEAIARATIRIDLSE